MYQVFLLVFISCPEDFINDIAIICEEDQSFRWLVQPPDREYAFGIFDMIYDIVGDTAVGCTRDANGFVQGDIDLATILFGKNRLSIHFNFVPGSDPVSCPGNNTINTYSPFRNRFIRFPPGTPTRVADIFIQANGIFVSWIHALELKMQRSAF
jgi:hypothetical protein